VQAMLQAKLKQKQLNAPQSAGPSEVKAQLTPDRPTPPSTDTHAVSSRAACELAHARVH